MESTTLRTYVGRTPLIRAKNLEKKSWVYEKSI